MISHHLARFVARLLPLSATAGPAIVASASQTPSYGRVRHASQSRKDAGALLLLTRRFCLTIEAEQARDRRQSKLASLIEADLRAVNHEIMRRRQ